MEDTDAQLHIKKRARRRLVGAVVFVSVVAVVLPMVMDHQPRQVVQDVEIRIPGQDEKPFAPKFSALPVEKPAPAVEDKPLAPAPVAAPVQPPAVAPSAKIVETNRDKPADKADEKPPAKVPEKPQAKPVEKPVEKPAKVEKPVEKAVSKDSDAQRAAAILAGKSEAQPAKSGEYLVLIGAFSNEANVKNLKEKLSQQGIKTFSEPLDTPQGKKTRVRAGPFASQDAAEKALAKMKAIGVSGVVAAK